MANGTRRAIQAAALVAALVGVLAGNSNPSGRFVRELNPTEISK